MAALQHLLSLRQCITFAPYGNGTGRSCGIKSKNVHYFASSVYPIGLKLVKKFNDP
jgi:hypothetical protein